VRDILTKSLGTTNPINLVRATVQGLQALKTPQQVARLRGLTVAQVLGIETPAEAAEAAPAVSDEAPSP
jgi:small subunit ribosomal protein S5